MVCLTDVSSASQCFLLHVKLIVASCAVSHEGACLQVYDVLKPNKHFRKGSPDDPRLVICLATGPNVPCFRVIQHLQQRVSPLPVQFATVAGGKVSFHSVQSST